jgi:hypothetical protein
MPLSTYNELVSETGVYMRRSGSTDFTSRIPTFIALSESWFNRQLANREQHIRATLTLTAGAATIPTDWIQFEQVSYVATPNVPLAYLSPDALNVAYPGSDTGYPEFYTIEGTSIEVRPVATGSLDVLYQGTVPALTSVNTTNWLLTKAPDIYLFSCLAEANAFIEEAEKAAVWRQRAANALDELVATGFRRVAQGQVMVVDRATP